MFGGCVLWFSLPLQEEVRKHVEFFLWGCTEGLTVLVVLHAPSRLARVPLSSFRSAPYACSDEPQGHLAFLCDLALIELK